MGVLQGLGRLEVLFVGRRLFLAQGHGRFGVFIGGVEQGVGGRVFHGRLVGRRGLLALKLAVAAAPELGLRIGVEANIRFVAGFGHRGVDQPLLARRAEVHFVLGDSGVGQIDVGAADRVAAQVEQLLLLSTNVDARLDLGDDVASRLRPALAAGEGVEIDTRPVFHFGEGHVRVAQGPLHDRVGLRLR